MTETERQNEGESVSMRHGIGGSLFFVHNIYAYYFAIYISGALDDIYVLLYDVWSVHGRGFSFSEY